MKNTLLLFIIVTFLAGCASSGHKEQSWQPKAGKKMKAGKNR